MSSRKSIRKYLSEDQLGALDPCVVKVLRKSYRKQRYTENDLKRERIEVDYEKERIRHIPSREDSLERLTEVGGNRFTSAEPGPEELTERKLMVEELRRCLKSLSENDRKIIRMAFFEGATQIKISQEIGITQSAVSRRLKKIIGELKNSLEK